jgi:hypothetical protein
MQAWRYHRKGVKSRDGSRHRLNAFRQGRTIFTTQRAVMEFLEAVRRSDERHFIAASEAPQIVQPQPTAAGLSSLVREAHADIFNRQ